VILVYSVLFGLGKVLLLQPVEGTMFFAAAAAAAWAIRQDRGKPDEGPPARNRGEDCDG
jgi:hypothetical protein